MEIQSSRVTLLCALLSGLMLPACGPAPEFSAAGDPNQAASAVEVDAAPTSDSSSAASSSGSYQMPITAPAQASCAPVLYNFVAGDRASCEASVLSRLGSPSVCTVGGGCAVDGHAPDGSHPSANPYAYGSCLLGPNPAPACEQQARTTPSRLPAQTTTDCAPVLYNFVAGDKNTCELSVWNRLGVQTACRLGGGCSLDGQVPDAAHPSANPGNYGACLAGPNPSSSCQQTPNRMATYNFVSDRKAACEASAWDRLGVVISCTRGGGCSLDGHIPDAAHPSANPDSYGACLLH